MADEGQRATALARAVEQTVALRELVERGEWRCLGALARARDATLRAALTGPAPSSLTPIEDDLARMLAREDARLSARAREVRDKSATRLAELRRSRRGARQYACAVER